MKGHAKKAPRIKSGTVAAQNVRGQLLGHQVTTKAAVPTSARPIGAEVSALLQPLQSGKRAGAVSGKQFVSPDLLAAWPEIVGERLAGLCLPVQMKAQPKSRSRHKKAGEDGAVLEVRADPSVQIDLDYGQALVLERINAFFGYPAVASLKVLAKPPSTVTTSPSISGNDPVVPTSAARDAAQKMAGHIEDDGLREALEELGASILSADTQSR